MNVRLYLLQRATAVLMVPLIAVLIPAIRLAPVLYNWRIRSRIYVWYGELKILELELKCEQALLKIQRHQQ